MTDITVHCKRCKPQVAIKELMPGDMFIYKDELWMLWERGNPTRCLIRNVVTKETEIVDNTTVVYAPTEIDIHWQ